MQLAHSNGHSTGLRPPLEPISMKTAAEKRPQQKARNGQPLLLVRKSHAAADAAAAVSATAAPAAAAPANGHASHAPAAVVKKPTPPKPALITAPTPAAAAAPAASAQSNGDSDASDLPQAKPAHRRTPPRQRDTANHVIVQSSSQPQSSSPPRRPRVLAASTLAQQLNGSQGSTPPSSFPRLDIDLTGEDLDSFVVLEPTNHAAAMDVAAATVSVAVPASAAHHQGFGPAQSKRKRDASPEQEERKEAPAAVSRHLPAFLTKKHRITSVPPPAPMAAAAAAASSACAAQPAASAAASHAGANLGSITKLDSASWDAGWNTAVSFQYSIASSKTAPAPVSGKKKPPARDSHAMEDTVPILDSNQLMSMLVNDGQLLPESVAPVASVNLPVMYVDLSLMDDDRSSEVGDEDESAGEQKKEPVRYAAAMNDPAKNRASNINRSAKPAVQTAAAPSSSPFSFSQRSGSLWQPNRHRLPTARPFAKKTTAPVDVDLTWSDSDEVVPGGHSPSAARGRRDKHRGSDADEENDDEVMELTDSRPAKTAGARAGGPIVSPARIDSIDSLADHVTPERSIMSALPAAAAAVSSSNAPAATVAAGARTSESDEIDSLADHISPPDGGKSRSKPAASAASAAAAAAAPALSDRLRRALNRNAKLDAPPATDSDVSSSPASRRQLDRLKKQLHQWSESDSESSRSSSTDSGQYPPQDPRVGPKYQLSVPPKLTKQEQRADRRFLDEERYVIPAAYRHSDHAASWAGPKDAVIAARSYDISFPILQDDAEEADNGAADAFVAAADAADAAEEEEEEEEPEEDVYEVERFLAKRLDRSRRGKKCARFKQIAAAIEAAERAASASRHSSPAAAAASSSPVSLPAWSRSDERFFCYLVKWADYPDASNSWEPYEGVRQALRTVQGRETIPFEHQFRATPGAQAQMPDFNKKAATRRKKQASSTPSEAESASPKASPAAARRRGGRRRNQSRGSSTQDRVPRMSAASLVARSPNPVGIPTELDVLHDHAFLSSAQPLDSSPATSRSVSDVEDTPPRGSRSSRGRSSTRHTSPSVAAAAPSIAAMFAALSRPSPHGHSLRAASASASARIERKEDGGGRKRHSDHGHEGTGNGAHDTDEGESYAAAAPAFPAAAAAAADADCAIFYNNSPSQTGPEESSWWVRGDGSHMTLVAAESCAALHSQLQQATRP